jgi:hypothetical protein
MLATIALALLKQAAPFVLIALIAFGCGVAWENRPAGQPRLLFWAIGDSLAAQRDRNAAEAATWREAYTTERGATTTLAAAIDLQNQAALSVATWSQAWQGRAAIAEAAAQSANAWRLKLAQSIMDTPTPVGQDYDASCHAAEAVLREGGQ